MLRDAVDARTFPGAVAALIARADEAVIPFGFETYEPDARAIAADAMFDIASLTKVVATTTAIMQLVERGRLSLSDPACTVLPRLDTPPKNQITIAHLLAHTAGFPGGEPLLPYRTRDAILEAIWSMDLVYAPGTDRVYDDVGFILLGLIVEAVTGTTLDRYCEAEIFAPLGMDETTFAPPAARADRIVPTEIDPARGGLLRGIVHDERAANLGGVAGHAGLFSTARDLGRFARAVLGHGGGGSDRVLSRASVRLMAQRQWQDDDGEYGLGWDRLRPRYMDGLDDADALGHTGFTGTSLVISPRRDLAMILLTNRVHPTRSDPAGITLARRRFVEAALRFC